VTIGGYLTWFGADAEKLQVLRFAQDDKFVRHSERCNAPHLKSEMWRTHVAKELA
jgi:hypothetical protein